MAGYGALADIIATRKKDGADPPEADRGTASGPTYR